jgi:nucleoside 2-deoxyribosyltransferase
MQTETEVNDNLGGFMQITPSRSLIATPSRLVYLAGPIAGLSYDGATDWREYAIQKLYPIIGLSPMRAKECLKHVTEFGQHGFPEHALSTQKAITARDRFDCQRSDLVIFNLLGATRVTIGTMIEMGWADAARVPSIVIMEKDGSNLHEHAIVNEICGFRASSLDEAIDLAKAILVETIM